MPNSNNRPAPHVVIIGGGFGGLYAAQSLARAPVRVTLIDKRNFHLFQPLLYQVATGMLSPGDIASPLRAVLRRHKNIRVLQAEATDLDPQKREVVLRDGVISYDYLVIATGSSHHYFGNDEWADSAPALKTIEGALTIRRRIFLAFEAAEREHDPAKRSALQTFVIVGGGPTGVELAGALSELAFATLREDFRHLDLQMTKIYLIEGQNGILSTYPNNLSEWAATTLARRGVTVCPETMVTGIKPGAVRIKSGRQEEIIYARTVLWAAGVKASPLGEIIAGRTDAALDRGKRIKVEPDLSLPDHPNIFVIGDLAYLEDKKQQPLPGLAPVAMQQGKYVAKLIANRLNGKLVPPFNYRDKGQLAVIGRNKAIVITPHLKRSGLFAWIVWAIVHIRYLIEFDNKLIVMVHWAWNYFTRNRGTRLITGDDPLPLVQCDEQKKVDYIKSIKHPQEFEVGLSKPDGG